MQDSQPIGLTPDPPSLRQQVEADTQAILDRFDARLARVHRLLDSPTRRWWARAADVMAHR